MSKPSLPLLFLFAVFLAFGSWIPSASAHSGTSVAYSDIEVKDGMIHYALRIDMYDLRVAVTPNDPNIGQWTTEVLEPFVRDNQPAVANYLLNGIQLYADSLPLDGKLVSLKLTSLNDQPYADAELVFPLQQQPEHLILDYHIVFDDVDQWHANYVTLTENGKKHTAALNFNDREVDVGRMSMLRAVQQFFVLGVEHLLTGYDHMLFLLALLIGARSFRQILMVITAFTAAHTITLLLASMQVISLSSRIVEPIIALSIIYVALSSLLRKEKATKHNVWLAFGFGLIHGFGFAGTLTEMRLDSGQFFSSLLTFNVGIEAGQVLIVLILYPLVRYARRWEVSTPAIASAISLCGFIWFIQRLFF